MAETLFEELKRYVNWGVADERALRLLHPLAQPHFVRVADVFYERILEHEHARTALENEAQVGRLKVTLVKWMERLFQGPWDEEYYELRARIGRVHVRIALPQHYMFGAMNVLRRELNALIDGFYRDRPEELAAARAAFSRILDIELAIMLHTYREDLLSQQAKAERLSTFGQLVGSIGHELRNPLGVIESSLYILKSRTGGDERAAKHVARIGEQVAIANSIITQLLDMIRDRPLQKQPLALAEVVEQAIGSVTRPTQVSIATEGLATLPPIEGDPVQVRQVFVNLVENAVQASGKVGSVRLTGKATGKNVEVTVEDSGPGVDPTIRRRLFEPLVTTKQKGIGLGLALVKRIVERHGGTIAYRAGLGGGACFVIHLPAASAP
jgi:two-component system, NtrC family, sensor histidine kinase HydH